MPVTWSGICARPSTPSPDVPELLEIETYRRAAEPVVGRRIATVDASDDWYAKGATTTDELCAVLPGLRIVGTRRIGKLLLIDTDGPVLGLRFGMTGRLLVDGGASIEQLQYSSARNDPVWDRFGLTFHGGGDLVIRDPRRLGGVELDPDEARLGPDAAAVTLAPFRLILTASSAPVKARLMDQAKLAGLGNLLTDEILWRAGVDPTRAADSLTSAEIGRLHRAMRRTLEVLGTRGGSHCGDLQPARERGGRCPKDGEELRREAVGGRTTYWCPRHQS
jgi:formamidopyrimidine-DNA glycosylase